MPQAPAERVHDLEDFVTLLRGLLGEGFEFVVIGGCAVGAYGRMRDQEILTVDLDILAPYPTLWQIVDWAARHGAVVRKRPQPRNIPVAFLEWEGLEVNVLADTPGLPPAERSILVARVARLSRHGNLPVPIVDPFDLLADKLRVNREKDQPHIEFMRSFVQEEVVDEFAREEEPRKRLAGARRLLAILGGRTLPEPLVRRLVPLARLPSDFRFLMNAAPTEDLQEDLLQRAGGDPELVEDLQRIRRHGPPGPPP